MSAGFLKGFPDLPPIWFAGFCGAAWLLARELPLTTAFGPLWWGLGVLLAVAGVALIGWSAWWFWLHRTPIESHHDPSECTFHAGPTDSRSASSARE